MIESAMLVALGFLLALLLSLLLAPAFWRRAVRLTTERIQATMPMSVADMQADKDQLRAEFAIRLRRVEMALEKAKDQAARNLVERNKHQTTILGLEESRRGLEASLAERSNAATVLEQTVKRRIPELEAQIARERDVIAIRDRELLRLGRAYDNQTEALGLARQALARREEELESLRQAIETNSLPLKSKRGRKAAGGAPGETEEDRLRGQIRLLEAQLSRLRQELGDMRQQETTETGALRAELQRLASLMMTAAEAPAPAVDEMPAEDVAGEEPAKEAKKTSRAKAAPKRKRLRDRLKVLSPGDREKAEA
ncbi:MAG: hypothetical protein AB7G34_15020 [Hyphomicrobiales bacterium]